MKSANRPVRRGNLPIAKALSILLLSISCSGSCLSQKATTVNYLNQTPPGMEAKLFAPGVISTNSNEHSPIAFSPDGSVVLWAVMDSHFKGRMFEMKYSKGSWSTPASPAFADTTADDYCPSFSPDGKKLFFSSRRKAPDGFVIGRGNRIWSVERTSAGWGIPVPFDTLVSRAQEFSHSISSRGTIYFSSQAEGRGNLDILQSEMINGNYTKPVSLPGSINSPGYEDGPYISPGEDFLIFESTRPEGIEGSHDLYICFKDKMGQWEKPVNMGPKINSGSMERFPRLSPDGKYFFFASNRDQSGGKKGFDTYWIDSAIIEELRVK